MPEGHWGLHTTGRLAQVSPRRALQMADYRPARDEFLTLHPWCQFPGCTARSEVVHHAKGRDGERLLIVEHWRASCVPHNDFAETHTGEALALGWLLPLVGAVSGFPNNQVEAAK